MIVQQVDFPKKMNIFPIFEMPLNICF